ncbi:MAG: helicase-associated domain-containing protein [Deltaproteobacteria bacterium]
MPFSTRSALPTTWPLESLNLELVAKLLHCSTAEAHTQRDRFAAHHADDAWLDRTLAALPVPALCVAAALASHGGMLHHPELEAHTGAFGLEAHELDAGVFELLQLLLVAPLQSPRGECLALVTSGADRLAARVAGLELVPLAREAFVADPRGDSGRSLIAAAMALATTSVRLTTAGALNRTGIKKLAKQLGHDADALEHLIYAGLELGLVSTGDDDELSPALDHLHAAAVGRYPHLPGLESLAAWMRDGAPVAVDAIEAYSEASMYRGSPTVRVDLLGLLPGFTAGTVGARASLIAVEPTGHPAASVTPSFEVFVPPESHPRDLVDILAACEVTRIDRAIVARITKSSVSRAIGRGATADQILGALAAATRTPLPQNVGAAIRDWAGSTTTATIDRGTVVVVAPQEQARVLAALPRARAVAPGVIVIPEDVTTRAVSSALRKLGILERTPEPVPAPPPVAPITRALPVPAQATVLRARVAAYHRGDPHERSLVKHVVREPLGGRSDRGSERRAPAAKRSVNVTENLVQRVERWEAQHAEMLPIDGFDGLVAVLEQLSTVDRQFLLAARGRAELARRLTVMLPRPVLAGLAPDVLLDLENAFGCTPPRHADPDRRGDLDWHTDHALARLEAAARTHSTVVLDLGTRTCTIAVHRVAPRGTALLVFGEDQDAVSHAIRLDEIRAIADVPPATATAAGWQPAPGMTPPPGHVKCPCMSGKRYRDCCRSAIQPS